MESMPKNSLSAGMATRARQSALTAMETDFIGNSAAAFSGMMPYRFFIPSHSSESSEW
jgi:hypothetical protein